MVDLVPHVEALHDGMDRQPRRPPAVAGIEQHGKALAVAISPGVDRLSQQPGAALPSTLEPLATTTGLHITTLPKLREMDSADVRHPWLALFDQSMGPFIVGAAGAGRVMHAIADQGRTRRRACRAVLHGDAIPIVVASTRRSSATRCRRSWNRSCTPRVPR